MPRALSRLLRRTAFLFVLAHLGQVARATEEVPFITSPDNVTLEMLRIAGVGGADHVIDLGSGDGRIVILAAKRFGATGLGVEIDPMLVRRSIANARSAGVADKADFRVQDLFETPLERATVVTMYLLTEVNLQLRPRLLALKPGTRIVSHDWDMGDWKPDETTVLQVPDKSVGLEKSSKVHLWTVPAQVAGLWCGEGLLGEFALRFEQRYQEVDATLTRRGLDRQMPGRLQGAVLRTAPDARGSIAAEVTVDRLRITEGTGPLALLRGQRFARSRGTSCQ